MRKRVIGDEIPPPGTRKPKAESVEYKHVLHAEREWNFG